VYSVPYAVRDNSLRSYHGITTEHTNSSFQRLIFYKIVQRRTQGAIGSVMIAIKVHCRFTTGERANWKIESRSIILTNVWSYKQEETEECSTIEQQVENVYETQSDASNSREEESRR